MTKTADPDRNDPNAKMGLFNRSNLPPGPDTVLEMLDGAAARWPTRPFLDFEGQRISYAMFRGEVDRLAGGLHAREIKSGDTISALLDSSLETLFLWFACNRVGAIFVPLNSALKGELLVHQVNDSLAAILVTDMAHRAAIERAAPGFVHGPELFIIASDTPATSPFAAFECLFMRDAPLPHFPTARGADPSLILYTSGTTGPSKGCIASHAYVTTIARKTANRVRMTEEDVSFSTLPLFHIFGMCGVILACMSRGALVTLRARFSVSSFWADVEASGATLVNAVGSMIPLIGAAPDSPQQLRCFGQIRVALGIPFSPEDIDEWRARFGIGWVGNIGYGMTEAATITEVDPDCDARLAQSGRPVDFDVRLFNAEGEECAAGETGEIAVRPMRPGIMFDGYWGRPVETLKLFRNLWFHTGDLGRFDARGNLIFVDRKKDYMRIGGENVSSYELESVMRTHPAITDVAAYGVPSALAEDDIKLSVVLAEGEALTEEALFSWCLEELPRYCVPRHIEFHTDLPRNPTGKILKFELRAAGITPATWSRAMARLPQ